MQITNVCYYNFWSVPLIKVLSHTDCNVGISLNKRLWVDWFKLKEIDVIVVKCSGQLNPLLYGKIFFHSQKLLF